MKDVDAIELQTREAAFDRRRDGVGDAAELIRLQPHLGADDNIGRLQLLQNAAEVLFRFAVAIQYRRVEIVHTGVDCPRDETLLVSGIAAHHDAAYRAAAESQRRDLHSGAAKYTHLHRYHSRGMRPSKIARNGFRRGRQFP